jgi:hypothetical protein
MHRSRVSPDRMHYEIVNCIALEFAWGSSCLVAMGVCGKDNGLDVYEYGIGGLYMCKGNAGGRAAGMGYIPG